MVGTGHGRVGKLLLDSQEDEDLPRQFSMQDQLLSSHLKRYRTNKKDTRYIPSNRHFPSNCFLFSMITSFFSNH